MFGCPNTFGLAEMLVKLIEFSYFGFPISLKTIKFKDHPITTILQ